MEQALIGRERERQILRNCYESGKPELLAVYGRRRVGKTFLVRKYFKDKFDFYTTGIQNGSKNDVLNFFNKQLNAYSRGVHYPVVDNWFDAFDQLRDLLQRSRRKRKVVFLDEMPWMETKRSKFLMAFDLFWNSWASMRSDLLFIVCGSSTSWIFDKLIANKGGLHNRVTQSIYLAPFTLGEAEQYLKNRGFMWNRMQIIECYMVIGGVPFYLDKLEKGCSVLQNINNLFFAKTPKLRDEYSFLYQSLFKESHVYQRVVEILSTKARGMTRQEIMKELKTYEGGSLTTVLTNLRRCDLIQKYQAFGKKERGAMYQLTDLYTLFYLRYVKGNDGKDENFWINMMDNPSKRAWSGYAFEQVCFMHISQIKKSLGISGILANVYSWTGSDNTMAGQIDMVIDRRDNVINLCEMKFAASKYSITKNECEKMIQRMELFRRVTKTKNALHLVMITPHGITQGKYSDYIQKEVTVDELFSSSL